MKKKLDTSSTEHRMYTLVMYNLSGIQKGIQSAHAIAEYSDHGDAGLYNTWFKAWKTIIVLNGGTSTNVVPRCPSTGESRDSEPLVKGSMEQNLEFLKEHNIMVTPFYEPDLNYSLSSMAFVLPEYMFKYDDLITPFNTQWKDENEFNSCIAVRDWLEGLRLA